MSSTSTIKIAIVGRGFAACMSALALSKQLPDNIDLTFVHLSGEQASDPLYGSVTSPDAYKNNLSLGISEPELFLNTKTSFSFGTHFINWAEEKLEWMQCFNQPFIAEKNVPFHHLMTKHKANIADYLISAQAAKIGRFAHPPVENPQSALSRAEYGYHFDVEEWSALFLSKLSHSNVNVIEQDINAVRSDNGVISSLELNDGQCVEATLFIDCTGPDAHLLSTLTNEYNVSRWIEFQLNSEEVPQTGPSFRLLKGQSKASWESITPLQRKNIVLSVAQADSEKSATSTALGERPQAWVGNCVGLGHSVYMLEPLTPAPYMLLSLDIVRLLELIPIDQDMSMERKEYNRRYRDDVCHAKLFEDALYYNAEHERGLKYKEGLESKETRPENAKLERKLKQFSHRGVLSSYDLEPFNNEDWIVLHWGMKRIPQKYDKLADQLDNNNTNRVLANMKNGIAHLASQLPPHHVYLEKFLQYVREQHGNK